MSYCSWDQSSELNIKYHDTEWGVPLHDDRGQFEFLMMEVMQCGLNWTMMINKREIYPTVAKKRFWKNRLCILEAKKDQ